MASIALAFDSVRRYPAASQRRHSEVCKVPRVLLSGGTSIFVAALTLAMAVGVQTAVYSLVNAILLRPLPIVEPTSLIALSSRGPSEQLRLTSISVVGELSEAGLPLRHLCGYNGGLGLSVEGRGVASQAMTAFITGECFSTFGVQPQLGRLISIDDAPAFGPGRRVAVIGSRLWRRLFDSDPRAIGELIRAEGVALEVVGILPDEFGGIDVDNGVDVFVPFDTVYPAPPSRRPGASHILARLSDGGTIVAVRSQLLDRWSHILDRAAGADLAEVERSSLLGSGLRVESAARGFSTYRTRYGRALELMLTLTALLTAVAVANVGGLLLFRLYSRMNDYRIRAALGATRARITAVVLIDATRVVSFALLLSIPITYAVLPLITATLPTGTVDPAVDLSPDWRVAVAFVVTSVLVVAGVSIPSLWLVSKRSYERIAPTRTVAGTARRLSVVLVAGQVAVSTVLLAASLLLAQSLWLLQRTALGIEPAWVLNIRLLPLPGGYADVDNGVYYPTLLEEIASIRGVRSVGLSRMFPRLITEATGQPVAFQGEEFGTMTAVIETVSPDFFNTVGIPVLSGRSFSWTDDSEREPVAVISRRLAEALSPGADVVGRRLRYASDPATQAVRIVGVVKNATLGNPRETSLPIFYRPTLQTGRLANFPTLNVAVTPTTNLGVTVAQIRSIVDAGGREYVHSAMRLVDSIRLAPHTERLSVALAVPLGLLALGVAAVGLYVLLSHWVAQREREIGIRAALGATPRAICSLLHVELARVLFLGLATGIPLGWAVCQVLANLAYEVSPGSLTTYVVVTFAVVLVGLAASAAPTWRALTVQPAIALRDND